jgi:hypothetical protein
MVIWSRPRVNTVCAWVSTFFFLPLLPSLTSSLHHLLVYLAILYNRKYPSGSSSCQVQFQLYFRLHRLQLFSTNFKFNCQLYFRTSQSSIVFYQYSSSIVTILPEYSGYNYFLRFLSSSTEFFGFLFSYQYLKYLA